MPRSDSALFLSNLSRFLHVSRLLSNAFCSAVPAARGHELARAVRDDREVQLGGGVLAEVREDVLRPADVRPARRITSGPGRILCNCAFLEGRFL